LKRCASRWGASRRRAALPAATEACCAGARLDVGIDEGRADALAREIAPIDDVRSTARYRTRVAQNLLPSTARPPAAWTRYTYPGEEFSVELPAHAHGAGRT
jgi:hypothetical protein